MWNSDLRFVILVAINIVKSHVAMPWEWDPFEVTANDHLTWTKFTILTSLFFLFSFISIKISLTSPNPNSMGFVQVRIKNFSPSLLTCFLACLFLPQYLFWYAYPIILVSFWWYDCVSNALASFVLWIGAMLAVMPDFSISIAAASNAVDVELDDERGGEHAAYVEQV